MGLTLLIRYAGLVQFLLRIVDGGASVFGASVFGAAVVRAVLVSAKSLEESADSIIAVNRFTGSVRHTGNTRGQGPSCQASS